MKLQHLRAARRAQRSRITLIGLTTLLGIAALAVLARVATGTSVPSSEPTTPHASVTTPRRSPRSSAIGNSDTTTRRSIAMFTRFVSWLAIGLAAAFLVVASASFGSLSTIAWLAFGISIGTLVVSVGIAYVSRHHIATLVAAVVTAVVSGWTIVASLVFSHPTVQNLALAGALAIGGLAVVGLTANELSSERIVHSLEVSVSQESRPAAA
jgi:hypothetical protein